MRFHFPVAFSVLYCLLVLKCCLNHCYFGSFPNSVLKHCITFSIFESPKLNDTLFLPSTIDIRRRN